MNCIVAIFIHFHLNTSNVIVQLLLHLRLLWNLQDLNTSNVIVQPKGRVEEFIAEQFKYIQCYCSTFQTIGKQRNWNYLNTSNVIVQRFAEMNNGGRKVKFKYIQCYCSTRKDNRYLG